MAAGLFYQGELPRIVLGLLRKHPEGLGLRFLVEMICDQKGWERDDTRFNRELRFLLLRSELVLIRLSWARSHHGTRVP